MAPVIFKALLYIALGRGFKRGLHWRTRKGVTTTQLNAILKDLYIEPITQALNQKSILFDTIRTGDKW